MYYGVSKVFPSMYSVTSLIDGDNVIFLWDNQIYYKCGDIYIEERDIYIHIMVIMLIL